MISPLNSLKHLIELRRAQYLPLEKLQERQNTKLRAIVMHAYNNVPYYNDLFKKLKLIPDDIRTTGDLKKLPILTRQDVIQNYPDRICAKGTDVGKCLVGKSSGTTGETVTSLQDKSSAEYSTALVKYAFMECGMKVTDRFVEITFPANIPGFWFQKLGLFRKELLSIYNNPTKHVEDLKRIKPQVLYSSATLLTIIIDELDKHNEKLPLKLVFPEGERTTPLLREKIKETFGASVFTTYGANEFYRLAFECEQHEGMHIITDAAVVEILRNDERVIEEMGEIIVTGLYNYAMPLINYKIGDVGILTWKNCTCGRNWPILKQIDGRTNECIVLENGLFSPLVIEHYLERISGVKKFRCIQEKIDKFTIKIIPDNKYTIQTVIEIQEIFRKLLGHVSVKINTVNFLSNEKSGKFKAFISKLPATCTGKF